MNLRYYPLLFILFFQVGISTKVSAFSSKDDSCLVTVKAIDLSEDMSSISSKNDEMLLLIYLWNDEFKQVSANKFVFKEGSLEHSFYLKPIDPGQVYIYLVEMDTYKTIEQINAVIKEYHENILKFYREEQWTALETYFGDDDLLYTDVVSTQKRAHCLKSFTVSGMRRLDTWHYEVTIK